MKYIAYLRVSTKRQGDSGLGLEAQRAMINQFVAHRGGEIIKEYVEVRSGTDRKRKAIAEAVALSQAEKATIIVAKLDRLARDAEYAHYIRNNAYNITACDLPDMNKMMFGIFVVFAEYERDLISQRTKAALQAKRDQGWVKKMEKPAYNVGANHNGAIIRWADKKEYGFSVVNTIAVFRKEGMTLEQIANKLNAEGERTITGAKWSKTAIKRICDKTL